MVRYLGTQFYNMQFYVIMLSVSAQHAFNSKYYVDTICQTFTNNNSVIF